MYRYRVGAEVLFCSARGLSYSHGEVADALFQLQLYMHVHVYVFEKYIYY